MKSFRTVLAALAAIVMASSCNANKTADAPSVSPLHVEGTLLVNGNGETVALRGISFGWHNIWPRFYNAEVVNTLHEEWGANIFRAAIGADDHAAADNPGIHGGYDTEPEFALEHLYNVVDAAIANGCYVIVDWHSHAIHTEEAIDFFTKVATKYKGVPNVIYELFNEPVCFSFEQHAENPYADLGNPVAMRSYWEALRDYAQTLIKVITDIDDREPLILMGCPCWDQRMDLPADYPVEGYNNLMYTMHFYAASHGQSLRDATDYALSKGCPVFISECAGMESSGDGFLDVDAWNTYSEWATERNMTMMAWSISDKVESCSMLFPGVDGEGNWTEDDIKPWGKIVKDWILKK